MSDETKPRILKALYTIHPSFEILDLTGPLEILSHARYSSSSSSPASPLFTHTLTAVEDLTTSNQKVAVQRHISIQEAHATLADYDLLVVPGGGSDIVLGQQIEPLDLIRAFVALPPRQDGGIRTLLSVCTGSLFLAEAEALPGLTATTHPGYYQKLRDISAKLEKEGREKTVVLEERFVVNPVDEKRGLRVITAGGVSCGMDAALWLIGDLAGEESKERAGETVQYQYRDGVVL